MPLPLGPSSAVSEPLAIASETLSSATKLPNRFVTWRTAIAIGDSPFRSGYGLRRFIASRVMIASTASTTEAVYAPTRSNASKRSSTCSVSVSVLPAILPGDDGDRAELAERARRREDDAVRDAPADRRQRDLARTSQRRRAERPGRLLLVGADLAEHGDDLADDERERDEDRREHHAGQREDDADPVVGEPLAEPAFWP